MQNADNEILYNLHMKNRITTTLALLCFHILSVGQPCLPGGITFTSQAEIDNFQINYPNCTEIEGNVAISGSNIKNLLGLSAITQINGDLSIYTTDSLASLTGLNGLTSLGGALTFSTNQLLTNFTGLTGLKSVGGYFVVLYHPALVDFSGLDSLTTIGNNLEIVINWGIESLNGLERLTSIGGNLFIYSNPALANLSGLVALQSVGGSLSVDGNQVLTSLSGLDSVAPESITQLFVVNNPVLSACNVRSVCDYLSMTNAIINIGNNAEGCNSRPQVEDACEHVSANSYDPGESFISIFPVPCRDQFVLPAGIRGCPTGLTIYNSLGKRMDYRSIRNNVVDITGFQPGTYILLLKSKNGVKRGKIVVI